MNQAPAAPNGHGPLLEVRELTVAYGDAERRVLAADGVSFRVECGEMFGIVGESGSGKSTVIRAILRLLPPAGRNLSGEIRFRGTDLAKLPERAMRGFRGSKIAMISQDPLTALNPVLNIETQIGEPLRHNLHLSPREVGRRVREQLDLVGVSDAARRLRAYPHELSGGLRQRVAIACALINSPQLLLADEPTTALDVTIQDQILRLLVDLMSRLGMGVVLVTHDLGIVAQTCHRVAVMYAGRVVETGQVSRILRRPAHPYSEALLRSIPRLGSHGVKLVPIQGAPPELHALPPGCSFAPRCTYAIPACTAEVPSLVTHAQGHLVACIRHELVGGNPDARPDSLD